MLFQDDLLYMISLSLVPHVGCVHARALLQHFGSAESIFMSSLQALEQVEGIGKIRAHSIKSFAGFGEVQKEMAFLQRYGVRVFSVQDPEYPKRLLPVYDAPLLLYYKGNADLNAERMVSVIGTRRPTDYGRVATEKILQELLALDVTIISGLAFGIDALAHKQAVKLGMPTIAVLAHGLASLYPPEHAQLSRQMLARGGLITEYSSQTKAEKHHFPIRNRIVAGMSDCTIVIETAVKGGSMITADIANGYHREVFALPGRITDFKSAGCNWLIRNHQATLLENIGDLTKNMAWDSKNKVLPAVASELFPSLTETEQRILDLLTEREQMHIDVLNATTGFPNSKNASALLELEMKDLICHMPGRIYRKK